ncbi:MAG: lipid A export permease/ATP-binding protein MsbA [Desulfobacterales bacterium]|jgi:subfamily B ATP-binding cassette protein MsbA|nr:lipid A export permease/ATP-binding protein MsbA [Desulfobacterales bacterium]MDD3081695.1 lipid A export permease/ATP-binding protein MsbA [Desulfobacterales bacterium]MDD3949787.1 lipid A export permease/ATP-binding protein MsbA [Desulfobacterales bacterium]MDY0377467.1 lipid A export permease/ATP-binding protein MsbA [Desulfobacterales bacterium]
MKIGLKFKITTRQRQLFDLIKRYKMGLFLGTACMLLVAASSAVSALLIKPVMDDIFVKQDIEMLRLMPIVVVVVFFLRGLGDYGQEYYMNYVGQRIIKDLRDRLYERVMDLPLSFFQQERTGVLMSRITNDVNVIRSMVSTAVTSIVRHFFTILGLIVVVLYRDWKLALCALVILPIAFFPVVEFGRRVRRVSRRCQESMAELNSFLHETFAGSKIVKAFGMEDFEKKRFVKKTDDLFELEIKTVIAKSLSSPVMELLGGLGIAFVVWYGGYSVVTGASTPGTFFSFMAAVLMLYDPVKKLSRLNNAVQEGLAASDRVFDILEKQSDIQEKQNPVELVVKPHRVRFEKVSFQYDRNPVLKDIDLDVQPGEILALVGMSGGGKTSLVNLIPRFYDVAEGAIRIDGVDIRDASLASLRRQIAVVTQEPILFNDTVASNIAYGNPLAEKQEIVEAAVAAYAYDFVTRFPKGFDTNIGELGGRLSGGEKQRICIARALLKNAPILILDEATSALDAESEMWVQKALENLMRGRTTFVIAHRLSTISYADRIVVLVNGRIVEQGRHEDLMALEGEYFKLHQMQFSKNAGVDCPK